MADTSDAAESTACATAVRDVGLAALSLQTGEPADAVLPSGRLLHCGCVGGLGLEELRRPKTVIRLMGAGDGSAASADEGVLAASLGKAGVRCVDVAVPVGDGGALSGDIVGAALGKVFHLVEDGVEFPILLTSRRPRGPHGELSLLVAAAALRALGAGAGAASAAAEALILRWGAGSSAPEGALEQLLGDEAAIAQDGIDLDRVRTLLQGQSAEQKVAEAAWLKQDLRTMHKLLASSENLDSHPWLGELAAAGARLAAISGAGDAAVAFFFRGWALARLRREGEAREALQLGRALARGGRAKPEVMKQLERELASLPASAGLSGRLVVEPAEAGDAVDPAREVVVVQAEASEPEGGGVAPSWQLLRCPDRFSWIIYAPPSTLFAACCSPGDAHGQALRALGLVRDVRADGSAGAADPPAHSIVEAVAEILKAGEGCFLHSSAGSATTGIALACFICKYGFGYPEDWTPTHPAHAASEAIDLVRGLQGEAALGGAEGEAAVAFFEKALWAEIIMGSVQKKAKAKASASAADAEAPSAVASAKVVRQPGDGNCLFHSLAYVVGGEKAATLRKKICEFMQNHPDLDISGTSLTDWLQMSAQCSVAEYCKRMQRAGEWGGAPELAVCARMKGVNVHVYQPSGSGFELVAPFYGNEDGTPSTRTVTVVYVGQMHYDALLL